MKKGILGLMALCMMFVSLKAQNQIGQIKESPVLMTVGSEKVTLSEFEAIFRKNNNEKKITKESLDEYIDLFVKFKLKVREAKVLKMDTSKAFKNELKGYVEQLSLPYLKNKDAEDKLVKETYDRMKYDLKMSHILVRVGRCSPPKDTLAAWNKIMKIRKEIVKKKNFEEAAKKFSEDSVTGVKGGLIGYYSAMKLAYPFETAAYNLDKGEISMPVRTSYGYHLIRLDDKRPARGQVKIAHIFIAANKDNENSYITAQKRINEAYEKLKAGEEFAGVCKTYSEDYNTSSRGGVLAPFGINQTVQQFEDEAFGLQNPDDYTKPFESKIGFHILKLIEKIGLKPYDEYKTELTRTVSKSKRWSVVKDAFTEDLKKQYKFEENKTLMKEWKKIADKNDGKLTTDQLKTMLEAWLFKIDGVETSSKELVDLINTRMPKGGEIDMCNLELKYYKPMVAQKLNDYKKSRLSTEYKEFRMLVNEYRDGILLFNLMDEKVWTKSVKDTSGLKAFHETNKKNYMWGQRVHAYMIDCKDDQAEELARKYADKLISGKLTAAKFLEKVNKKVKDNIFMTDGVFARGENKLVDQLGQKTGVSTTEKFEDKIKFVIVDRIVEPQPKKLKEAKGLVISDYQNYLEQEWLKELEGKYPVSVNKDVLYSLIGK